MKKTTLPLLCMLLGIFAATAQPQPTGNLTIFSEDGDKFYLILNGERQNVMAQTNLRVEELPQPYYNAKIIFEDKSLQEISKNYLQLTDADGKYADVTYKIKHDKTGKPVLRYFSQTPVQQNYTPPANVYIMHYGVPATTVTQTTTTTTVTDNNNVAVNMGVPGINMNVTVTDPTVSGTTETTTTRTTTIKENSAPPQPEVVGCNGNYAMTAGDFASAIATIKKEGFEANKLSTAKQIAGSNCLNANQVADICRTFGFEDSKLDFAKFAYDHCTEPKNYFKVNNVFTFSSSTDALNEYIQGR